MADDLTIDGFLAVLANEFDLDLRGYKHSTLERRVRKRQYTVDARDYASYVEYMRAHPDEKVHLLDTLLINVTQFFRDPAAWDTISTEVLPYLLRNKRPGDSLRIWTAGCATGEEVYSLAICLAERLGSRLQEYDIKIYATDIDEDALNKARRGEYPLERLRHMRPELRNKYFQGTQQMRIVRDVRRLVIFGRSDIVHDAPMSHVDMVVCRNVLIYFDTATQRQILSRLHYALDDGGILFLGKSESKLGGSPSFAPVDARWRIFRKTKGRGEQAPIFVLGGKVPEGDELKKELALLKTYQRHMLDILDPGLLMLDENDVVVSENASALRLWGISGSLLGSPVAQTTLVERCPDLIRHLSESRIGDRKSIRFQCRVPHDSASTALQVTIRPVVGEEKHRIGTMIYSEDISHREKLQSTVEQLESTGEELQSTNEELETTNEELQSTNEELETTNEELQSTNEELETTNEELQSLNEELENMNEELEFRTKELDALNARYASTLEHMPSAVLLIDSTGRVQFWNSAAQRLFDLPATAVLGLDVSQLPLHAGLRQALSRKLKASVERGASVVLKGQTLRSGRSDTNVQVHFTPLPDGKQPQSVLVMFAHETADGVVKLKSGARKPVSLLVKGTTTKKTARRPNQKSPAKKKAR